MQALLASLASLASLVVGMNVAGFRPIEFDDIPPSRYVQDGDAIRIDVDGSSSLLLQPFDSAKAVNELRFEWKSSGDLRVKDAAAQRRKDGDDARLRVGLLIAGKPAFVPFFAPAWIKMIRDFMKQPAGSVTFVLAGTPVPPASSWASPYNDDIRLVAAEERELPGGWKEGRFKPERPIEVVGLWLMADGDNTKSKFTTWIRSISLN